MILSNAFRILMLGLLVPSFLLYLLKKNITTLHHMTAMEAAKLLSDNISGRVFIITGGYTGLGAETAKALLSEGGRVVIGGRDPQKLEKFTRSLLIRDNPSHSISQDSHVDGFTLDLADLNSVKTFASYVEGKYTHEKIVLINNAGIICQASTTRQGLETQMGVMVVGHFLLSKLLLPMTTRQVWLSSWYHTMVNASSSSIVTSTLV